MHDAPPGSPDGAFSCTASSFRATDRASQSEPAPTMRALMTKTSNPCGAPSGLVLEEARDSLLLRTPRYFVFLRAIGESHRHAPRRRVFDIVTILW